MIRLITKYKYSLIIFFVTILLFYPSFSTFFTNDDFFFLKISNINTLGQFLNFFNIFKSPEGWGLYRPITTQVYFLLGWKLFHLQPFGLHVISFITLFSIDLLIYKLIKDLLKNNTSALIAVALYSFSATHFGHLYNLATFQELGATLFVLLSVLSFLYAIKNHDKLNYVLSILFYVLGMASKEVAIVTPILCGLVYLFVKLNKQIKLELWKAVLLIVPYLLLIGIYMYIRVAYYGFTTGDSYVWIFSPSKVINSFFWYLMWGLNIPEMLVDYVGPGLKLNPNLFKYFLGDIVPITIGFILEMTITIFVLIKSKIFSKSNILILLFGIIWFMVSLIPVIFLPIHKFTFYLTTPLIGIIFIIGYFLSQLKSVNVIGIFFVFVWVATSFFSLRLNTKTSWITQGPLVARRVYDYCQGNFDQLKGKTIIFEDSKLDAGLPWSPTIVVRDALSNNNFFAVYYPNIIKAIYNDKTQSGEKYVKLGARQFLGY